MVVVIYCMLMKKSTYIHVLLSSKHYFRGGADLLSQAKNI